MTPSPPLPQITLGQTYTYQGRSKELSGKQVTVIGTHWPGDPGDSTLVYVQVLSKGKPASTCFGCDKRWLSSGGDSPYQRYSKQLAKATKGMRSAVASQTVGLEDPEDQGELCFVEEED